MKRLYILLFFLAGLNCAYLNTFYNAKSAYNAAYKREKQLLKKIDSIPSILPSNIKQGYERAIEKSNKVVSYYPKSKKWHDDAAFLHAKAEFQLRNYIQSSIQLRNFQVVYPNSNHIPESYLYLAKAYLNTEQPERAEKVLLKIMEKYPKLNAKEDITLLLAKASIAKEGKSKAIVILEKSLKNLKSGEKKATVIYDLAGLYIDFGMYAKAENILRKAPFKLKSTELAFKLNYTLLRVLFMEKRYKEALKELKYSLRQKYAAKHKNELFYQRALNRLKLGEKNEAVKDLQNIVTSGKSNETVGLANFRLAEINLADNKFDKAEEQYKKARQSVLDKEILAIIEKRIKGLIDRVALTTSDTTTDMDTISIKKKYQTAEIFWLNLGKPDSALFKFKQIVSDTNLNKKFVEKSKFAIAWILRNFKQDTTKSDSIFAEIIKENPNSELAQKAQLAKGDNITVKTTLDSALAQYRVAEELFFSSNNPVSAVNMFYKTYKQYKTCDSIAAKSLYAAAWICDDILEKNKKAMQLYNKICDEYPSSEYCVKGAKPKLKAVKDTLYYLEEKNKLKNVTIDSTVYKYILEKNNNNSKAKKENKPEEKIKEQPKTGRKISRQRHLSAPSSGLNMPPPVMGPTK